MKATKPLFVSSDIRECPVLSLHRGECSGGLIFTVLEHGSAVDLNHVTRLGQAVGTARLYRIGVRKEPLVPRVNKESVFDRAAKVTLEPLAGRPVNAARSGQIASDDGGTKGDFVSRVGAECIQSKTWAQTGRR